MGESEPRKVEVNLVEAIDHHAPVIQEIRRAVRVLAVANKALESLGIELVTKKLETIEEPTEQHGLPTVDSLGLDEVAELVKAVRIAELEGVEEEYINEVFNEDTSTSALLIRVMKYIDKRRDEINEIADREPE